MKLITPFKSTALMMALAGSPAMAVDGGVDCNLTITVQSDCYALDLGWGMVTAIEGAITPYAYLWSNGATTQYVEGLDNGDHWVMVTDAAGCWHKVDIVIDCDKDKEPPVDEPCELRTQTQGGWGSPANGNNPGAYRNAHFGEAFPSGLVIGCDRTLTLTSAAAVDAFLPSGTTARMLNVGSMVDPGTTYKNVLAGQLVALMLSVGFDMNDPDFGTGGLLVDAVINNGTFQGWTVGELIDEANSFIGGCGSAYTASQLNSALSMVNENFVDGTTNNGDLDCSNGKDKKILINENTDRVSSYPNPAIDVITVDLTSMEKGDITISLIDALGRTMSPSTRMNVLAGDQRLVNIEVDRLTNGSYFLMVSRNGKVMNVQRVVIAH